MMLAVVEVHQFDQLEDEVTLSPDICKEIINLMLIDPFKHDHVELDRCQARIPRCVNSLKYVGQFINAGNFPVCF